MEAPENRLLLKVKAFVAQAGIPNISIVRDNTLIFVLFFTRSACVKRRLLRQSFLRGF